MLFNSVIEWYITAFFLQYNIGNKAACIKMLKKKIVVHCNLQTGKISTWLVRFSENRPSLFIIQWRESRRTADTGLRGWKGCMEQYKSLNMR